jgi:hypothetical protein
MDEIRDYFLCDGCLSKNFKCIYNFSLRFHSVNFSDDLIYDQLNEEVYQCTNCQKTFTKKQIEEGLALIKRRRKRL